MKYRLAHWVARHLPESILYYAAVRVISISTSDPIYKRTLFDLVTLEALRHWNEVMKERYPEARLFQDIK